MDYLSVQPSGLEALFTDSDSAMIHIKCFADLGNVVLANIVSTGNLARIMGLLTELQNLLRSRSLRQAIGKKYPRFIELNSFA
jgi:hypothetical protein